MSLDRHHAIRRLGQFSLATALGLVMATMGAGRALAECDGPIPSFRDHAASAKRIIIGDVIEVDPDAPWTDEEGRSSRFTLRVRHVVRGPQTRVISLRDRAFLPCADHIIMVGKGDRIALALDARSFRSGIRFDTLAWITGTPPASVGVEYTTVREAFSLVGKDLPETSTAPPRPGRQPSFAVLVALLAAAVAGTMLWRTRLGQQASR